MEQLLELLKGEFATHPEMEPEDGLKFLHQSFMGPGHLVPDEETALARLEEEWACLSPAPEAPLFTPLGGGLLRLELAACKGRGLSPATAARLFFLTARDFSPDPQGLRQALPLLLELPFPPARTGEVLERYLALGCPMVSHSPRYRRACSPAYRVISAAYRPVLPILAAIDSRLSQDGAVRVALDGPCASGKSTVGRLLAEVYRCPLIHMDDFFLRPEQRTPARLAQPGGNVDYERFTRQVLAPMLEGEEIVFSPWRCALGALGPEQRIPPHPVTVVEGSYSLRPDLREGYTLRVWVEAPWPVRLERLGRRGGPEVLERFLTTWIPLEDKYFRACQVRECCHLTCCPT